MAIKSTIYCINRGVIEMIINGYKFSDIRQWVGHYEEIEVALVHKGQKKKLKVRRGYCPPKQGREPIR